MANIFFSVPHQLGDVEARERIHLLVAEIKGDDGTFTRNFREDWAEFGTTISFTLLGGLCQDSEVFIKIRVEDSDVEISGTLDGLAGLLSHWILPALKRKLQSILEQPKHVAHQTA